MTRPLGRRAHALWLTVHLVGMAGWIGALVVVLALSWSSGPVSRLAGVVQWEVLAPCALATVGSGLALTRPYRSRCPRWLELKVYLASAAVLAGAVVLALHATNRAYTVPVHAGGVLVLLCAVALSVIRPTGRTSTAIPAPRHRR